MNENYWYYEERQSDGEWIDCMAGYGLSKDEAIKEMEYRKGKSPRSLLRLVHCVKTRFNYAQRRKA